MSATSHFVTSGNINYLSKEVPNYIVFSFSIICFVNCFSDSVPFPVVIYYLRFYRLISEKTCTESKEFLFSKSESVS